MRHTGITITHATRDLIRIRKDGVGEDTGEQVLTVSYAQAYDLREQLNDFLGAYTPDENGR